MGRLRVKLSEQFKGYIKREDQGLTTGPLKPGFCLPGLSVLDCSDWVT